MGLICQEQERNELADLLIRAGVTRVANGGDMSKMTPGTTHDGAYPLRRYSRVVEIEM